MRKHKNEKLLLFTYVLYLQKIDLSYDLFKPYSQFSSSIKLQMRSQQFSKQLQNNQCISQQHSLTGDSELSSSFASFDQEDYIKQKLKDILDCLQKEKTQFISFYKREKQTLVQKINAQKDKIIDDLLKTIHNLKNENEQLKFQYRTRFKVINNIEQKYQRLIETKNKKIAELESILNYLQKKVKLLEKKLEKNETIQRIEDFRGRQFFSPKQERPHLNSYKICQRINKEERNLKEQRKHILSSLDECTIPLASSFLSDSKASSNKTVSKKKSPGKPQIHDLGSLKGRFVSGNVYPSFVTSDPNINYKKIDNEQKIVDLNGITPVCSKNPSTLKQYLVLEDFDDFENRSLRTFNQLMRKSQKINSPQFKPKFRRLNQNI